MNYEEEKQYWESHDLSLVSFLRSVGINYAKKDKYGRMTHFYFVKNQKLEELIEDYYLEGVKSFVPAKLVLDNLRSMMAITSKQD